MNISYHNLRLLLVIGGILLILLTSGDINVFFGYPAGIILIFTGLLSKPLSAKASAGKGSGFGQHLTWPVLALTVITLCFVVWFLLKVTR